MIEPHHVALYVASVSFAAWMMDAPRWRALFWPIVFVLWIHEGNHGGDRKEVE